MKNEGKSIKDDYGIKKFGFLEEKGAKIFSILFLEKMKWERDRNKNDGWGRKTL